MTEFLLSIFYFIVFSFLISKLPLFNDPHVPKYWFIAIFGAKIVFSIILTAIYTNYYTNRETADIFKYFDDSGVMFSSLKTNPIDYFKMLFGIGNDNAYFDLNYYDKMVHWRRIYGSNMFSDSHIIIRFNAMVRLFSFGYFQVHNIFINFVSLIGLTAIFKAIRFFVNANTKFLFYTVFLAPSVLFWGSGLLKEGMIFFALGLLILHFFKSLNKFSLPSLLIIFFSLALIFYTKIYIIATIIPGALGYIIYKKIWKRNVVVSYLTAFSVIVGVSLFLNVTASKWDPFQLLINKESDFITLINRADVDVKSDIHIPIIENKMDVIKYIPNAWLNTFVRPYIWESRSVLIMAEALENLLIIALMFIALIYRKQKIMETNLFLFCISFVFTLFTIIGITTPVFGAIARYKVPGIPFLIIALFLLIDVDKLKHKFSFLNKII